MPATRKKRTSRRTLTIAAACAVIAFLVFSMRPRPILVDTAVVERGPMIVTIDEEGKTRVRDNYIVSAPVSGRLLRIDVHAGDAVEGQASIVARILPTNPSFLDARARTEAESGVRSAEAALAMAKAEVARTNAEYEYARSDAARVRALRQEGAVAAVALERAELALKSAAAQRETARAAVQVREAELQNARAHLITPNECDRDENCALTTLSLTAPITGRILRVLQESETIVSAGTPILEVGDLNSDLEIVSEYLSSDAVLISEGDRVIVEKWGATTLTGRVRRVEPYGFTKISALGVEEQRVNVVIDFVSPREDREGLGHGFRVETRVVVWEDPNALTAPSAALFREGENWAVFVNENGRARLRIVEVDHNNGVQAEVIDGLREGEVIVLYPSIDLRDGDGVKERNNN